MMSIQIERYARLMGPSVHFDNEKGHSIGFDPNKSWSNVSEIALINKLSYSVPLKKWVRLSVYKN